MNKQVKTILEKAKDAVAKRDEMTPEAATDIVEEINDILDHAKGTPWWVIALKAIAYIIGLILAGYGTTAAAQTLNIL